MQGGKVDAEDKEKLQEAVNAALEWLESNQDADGEEFKEKLKETEKVVNPIMAKVYQKTGGAPPGAGPAGGDDEDFGNEEL